MKRGRPRTVEDAEILEAAARTIAAAGPAGVTLGAVAADVGLAPATLVQRFGSKHGLLLALAERAVESVGAPFERARARRKDPLEALHEALATAARAISSREQMANQVGFLQLDLADPELGAQARKHARAFRREIRSLLDESVDRGLLTPADTERLARAVHAAYNGALLTWALDGEGTPGRRLREAVDSVLAGVRA